MNYLTIKDVAKKLSISERTAWNLVHDRVHPLPVFRIGRKIVRVKESDLHEWMEKHFRVETTETIDDVVEDVFLSLL